MTSAPIVPIIMGSKSDLEHGREVAGALAELGIASELRVASAHKSASHLLNVLQAYEREAAPRVYVTIAGRSNALGGMVDANVTGPVITCPPYSDRFGGADVFSSLRMPSGVAPALVMSPEGAALLAAKILAVHDPALRERVRGLQARYEAKIRADDAELGSEA